MPNPWRWCIGSSGVSAIAFVSGYKIAIAASQPTPSEGPVWCCALGFLVVVGVPAGPSSTLMHNHGEGAASFYFQRAYASATSPWGPTAGPFSFCLCLTVLTCSDRVSPSHTPTRSQPYPGKGW